MTKAPNSGATPAKTGSNPNGGARFVSTVDSTAGTISTGTWANCTGGVKAGGTAPTSCTEAATFVTCFKPGAFVTTLGDGSLFVSGFPHRYSNIARPSEVANTNVPLGSTRIRDMIRPCLENKTGRQFLCLVQMYQVEIEKPPLNFLGRSAEKPRIAGSHCVVCRNLIYKLLNTVGYVR